MSEELTEPFNLLVAASLGEHAADVDSRIGRAGDWYTYSGARNWRYDRSDLSSRWMRVRNDIGAITDYFGRNGRF